MAVNDWLYQTNQSLNNLAAQVQAQGASIQTLADLLIKQQQRSIPKYLTQEYMFSPSDQFIKIARQTNNIILVRTVLFQFSSADATTPAVLTLGDKRWFYSTVPTTHIIMDNLYLILKPGDERSLSQKQGGFSSILLMGEDLGEQGVW